MLFIKFWARFHDINDAHKKTISSYSLALMLIHYLQGKAMYVRLSVCLLSGLMLIHYLQGKAMSVCVSVCLVSGPHAYPLPAG